MVARAQVVLLGLVIDSRYGLLTLGIVVASTLPYWRAYTTLL